MVQLVYNEEMSQAYAGMLADSSDRNILSRLVEDAAGLKAGLFVSAGTLKEQIIVPTSAAEITGLAGQGVCMMETSKEPARTAAAIAAASDYDVQDSVNIVRKGAIWVLCDDGATILPFTQAFVRFAAGGGGTELGAFREDADTASAAALPAARFASAHIDANGNRIALLEINLT